jgi:hypothetical protein
LTFEFFALRQVISRGLRRAALDVYDGIIDIARLRDSTHRLVIGINKIGSYIE